MNLRERILCERLRLRGRSLGHIWSDDELRKAEDHLGYRLPTMLRHVYLEVGALQLVSEQLSFYRLPDDVSRSGWQIAPEVAKALRADTGSYVLLDGPYVALGDIGRYPDGFIQLVDAECNAVMNVLLDGRTGHIYYSYVDDRWTDISFCALSIEDWLERELDSSAHVRTAYHARGELTTIEGTTTLTKNLLRVPVTIERKRENTLAAAEGAKAPLREAKRRHEENLIDDDPADAEIGFGEPEAQVVWRAAWELERARHQILGQMYALMDILGEDLELSGDPAEGQTILKTLYPLIVADAQLAPILWDVRDGGSDLYDLSNIKGRIRHIASHAE